MKAFLLIAAFCFSAGLLKAQQDTGFTLVRIYTGDVAGAALDNLQNLYVLSSKGQIRKFNSNGDSVGIYNQVRNFGTLHSMDVSNPLKPVLFYKDFATVVILDRFLANRNTLDLRRMNILQPGAVALSYDNHLWVFDELENKLRKVDESGNVLLETADFRNAFGEALRPQQIIDENGMVYLADSAKGIYIFDNYGTFKKRVTLPAWQHLSVKEQYLVQASSNAVVLFNTQTYRELKKPFPSGFQPYQRVMATADRLITFSRDSLRLYSFHF